MFEFNDLLLGYTDEEGTHKDYELEVMTGKQEENIAKKSIKDNPSKIIRTLLEDCCIRIGTLEKDKLGIKKWREIIQNLYLADQDIMIMNLRKISVGEEIEVSIKCPEEDCSGNKGLTLNINIEDLEIIDLREDKDMVSIPFELPMGVKDKEGIYHKKGRIRYPKGLDREVLAPFTKNNLGIANTMLLTRCIEEFDIPLYDDLVRNMIIKDRNYLYELFNKNRVGVDTSVTTTCPHCGREFKVELSSINFI